MKTYDGLAQSIGLSSNDSGFVPVLSGDGKNVDVSYTLITDSSVTEPVNVGTYAVTYIVTDPSYTGGGNATLYINKGEVEIKAKDISKIYGDDPVFEFECNSALVSAEELAAIVEGAAFTSEGTDKKAKIGEYDVTVVLGVSGNQNLNFKVPGPGKLKVEKWRLPLP